MTDLIEYKKWMARHSELIQKWDEAVCPFKGLNKILSKFQFIHRNLLSRWVDRYFCSYDVMKLMQCVIHAMIDSSHVGNRASDLGKHLGESMQRWMTQLKLLSSNSAEGIVLSGSLSFGESNLIVKLSKHVQSAALVHEYTVGTILNTLRKDGIYNFMFVYGLYMCDPIYTKRPEQIRISEMCVSNNPDSVSCYMIMEKVPGDSLTSLLPKLSLLDTLTILTQIFLALEYAAQKFQFVHHDLHADNILVRQFPRPTQFTYPYRGSTLTITTRYLPVIIDFGYASIRSPVNNELISFFYKPLTQEEIKQAPYKVYMYEQNPHYETDTFKLFNYLFSYCHFSNPLLYSQLKSFFSPYFLPRISNKENLRFLNITAPSIDKLSEHSYFYPTFPEDKFYSQNPSFSPVQMVDYIRSLPEAQGIFQAVPGTPTCSCPFSAKELEHQLFSATPKQVCAMDSIHNGHRDFMDKYGYHRTCFECGKYYFDGNFPVIEYQKGLSLYVASGSMMEKNVALPLPLQTYYHSHIVFDPKELEYLYSKTRSVEDKIEKLRTKNVPEDVTFLLDATYAPVLSQEKLAGGQKCQSRCILAYQTTRITHILNLWDPLAIKLLLLSDDLSPKYKAMLALYLGAPFSPVFFDSDKFNGFADKLSQKDAWAVQTYNKVMTAFLEQFTDTASLFHVAEGNDPSEFHKDKDPLNTLQQAYHPQRRFAWKNLTYKNFPTKLYMKLNSICEKYGYDGFVVIRHPDSKGDGNAFAPILFAGKQLVSFLDRDYMNPNDWQYNDQLTTFRTIGKIIDDMKRYKTTQIQSHAGDLIQHSIWSALYTQSMLKTKFSPFIDKSVQNAPEMIPVAVAASFLHDIGKAGYQESASQSGPVLMFPDQEHIEHGTKILQGTEPYYIRTEDGKVEAINGPAILQDMNLNPEQQRMVLVIVACHELLETVLSNPVYVSISQQVKSWLFTVFTTMKRYKITFSSFARLSLTLEYLVLVSISDLKARLPFIDIDEFREKMRDMNTRDPMLYLNNVVEQYPYLTNMGQVYPGTDSFEKYHQLVPLFQQEMRNEIKQQHESHLLEEYIVMRPERPSEQKLQILLAPSRPSALPMISEDEPVEIISQQPLPRPPLPPQPPRPIHRTTSFPDSDWSEMLAV